MCRTTPVSDVVLAPDDAAARHARRFVDQHWCAEHAALLRGHALLIASELVTNAVHHGVPPVRMSLDCHEADGVVLSVSDADPNSPYVADPATRESGGRGIALVDVLSDEWGVRTRPGGKTVWSRLVC